MTQPPIMADDLAGLVALSAEAASSFIRGDMRRYFALITHTDDYTLMPPYGGEPRHGADTSDAALDALEKWFTGGDATLEVVQAYASSDLAFLAVIERQRGVVGALPEQDWSLRVTLVFRREDGGWKLMHRHADALTHPIDHDTLAALSRGNARLTS